MVQIPDDVKALIISELKKVIKSSVKNNRKTIAGKNNNIKLALFASALIVSAALYDRFCVPLSEDDVVVSVEE